METWIFSIKCLSCGLHFNVYSWEETWSEDHWAGGRSPFCPECGDQNAIVVNREATQLPIFLFVSAGTGLASQWDAMQSTHGEG